MGARVSEFFYKESKSKKKKNSIGGGEMVAGWGIWMDRGTGPNQFAPSTSIYDHFDLYLTPVTFYDHFII